MFDGIPDQFHQFMPSRTSLPLPPCTFPTTTFDPYTSSTHHQTIQPNDLFMHHPLHHHLNTTPSPSIIKNKVEEKDQGGTGLLSFDLDLERARSIPEPIDLWSHDEVFALLRVRSSMDSGWFPQDFTWEQVSRRLEELGFERSADKCKEKFEEESRAYFSNINNYKNNNNYRHFSELEEICHGDETQTIPHVESGKEKTQSTEKPNEEEEEEEYRNIDQVMEESSEKGMETAQANADSLVDHREDMMVMEEESKKRKKDKKKKKRHRKFEILKGFCEGFVKKMMTKQEELHNKLLEDMMKRDEEKFAIEETRKKQEMDRIDYEIQNREHEQAISGERQAIIIEFLEKYTFGTHQNQWFGGKNIQELQGPFRSISKTPSSHPNPNSYSGQNSQSLPTSSSPETLSPQTPTSSKDPNVSKVQTSSSTGLVANNPPERTSNSAKRSPEDRSLVKTNNRDDYGKRWPRDEVLALINTRCTFFNNEDDKGANNNKVPLWERISQKMSELGYKRSAKRCKEKWENINKYFRKTKDTTNRKRSLDSRTCPYFHQLSNLYNNQGGKTITVPEISSSSPGNH